MKKVWIIKDLWDETYKRATKSEITLTSWDNKIGNAKHYDSYEEAEKDVIPNSTIIEMFINE